MDYASMKLLKHTAKINEILYFYFRCVIKILLHEDVLKKFIQRKQKKIHVAASTSGHNATHW